MTLQLILTRHAKSSWDDANLPDHDRPLNPHGRVAAKVIGEWLHTRGYIPDRILCSTATRNRETCDLIRESMTDSIEVDLIQELYNASPDQMLDLIKGASGTTIMLIGHNPGCAALAARLAHTAPLHERFTLYPSAATTVFDFDADNWSQISDHSGVVREFVVPADLGVD